LTVLTHPFTLGVSTLTLTLLIRQVIEFGETGGRRWAVDPSRYTKLTKQINESKIAKEPGMSVSIKPLEDRIVVKASEAETTTASGLVIPDTAKEKPQEGTVIAVGPGRFDDGVRVPMDVKVGDNVIYSKYGGTEVKYNGEEYLVLSARDVLAILEK